MHYLPDTDEQDALTEIYWPDDFKTVVRQELREAFSRKMDSPGIRRVYRRHYSKLFRDVYGFVEAIVNTLVISAENGADLGFDAVYKAFLTEARLPEQRRYARSFWPQIMSSSTEARICEAIFKSYENDDAFIYAYATGYKTDYENYERFIDAVAGLILSGIVSGLDGGLEQLYKSFMKGRPLGTNRRNPKRLKTFCN